MNGHFGLAGAYAEDPGAWLQRTHEERRKREEREQRAIQWIRRHVSGTFHSREALTTSVCRVAVAAYGRALREDEREVIENAARIIFAGLSNIGAVVKLSQVGTVEYVVLKAA